MGKFVTECWVNADLTRVFAFFSSPENLPRLMPSVLGVELVGVQWRPPSPEAMVEVVKSGINPAKVAGPGSRIEISFLYLPFLPFRGRWVAQIVEYEPLSHFVDEQRSGPMRRWRHRHSFRAEERNGVSGTVVRDEVMYELPLDVLGRLADAVFVERLMRWMFESRQQQLQKLVSA